MAVATAAVLAVSVAPAGAQGTNGPGPSLVAGPTNDLNAQTAGTTHTVTAVLNNTAPVEGQQILFSVTGRNPVPATPVMTNDRGVAEFTYTNTVNGPNPPQDTIVVCLDADQDDACDSDATTATVTKNWGPPGPIPSLTLAQVTDTNPIGTPHTVTATTSGGGPVTFSVRGVNSPADATVPVGAGGSATFTYTGTDAGTDLIQACVPAGGPGGMVCDDATKVWTLPPPVVFTLTPQTATNPVGTEHTVTATLTSGGEPVGDALIRFNVTGANTATGEGATTEAGTVSFTYQGNNVGTDTITACVDEDRDGTCESTERSAGPVTKIWVEAPSSAAPSESMMPVTGAATISLATGGLTLLALGGAILVVLMVLGRRARRREIDE